MDSSNNKLGDTNYLKKMKRTYILKKKFNNLKKKYI